MGAMLALLALLTNDAEPWKAPTPDVDIVMPVGVARGIKRNVDGSAVLSPEANFWLGEFVGGMQVYPSQCQAILNQARDESEERRQKEVADAEARAEAAMAVQSQDVWSLGDRILIIGGVGLGGIAIGLLVGLVAN